MQQQAVVKLVGNTQQQQKRSYDQIFQKSPESRHSSIRFWAGPIGQRRARVMTCR